MAKKPVVKWAKVEKGALHGWKKDMPVAKRHALLDRLVKKDSYATTVRKLNQLRNVTKDQETKKIVKQDMDWLKKKYRS